MGSANPAVVNHNSRGRRPRGQSQSCHRIRGSVRGNRRSRRSATGPAVVPMPAAQQALVRGGTPTLAVILLVLLGPSCCGETGSTSSAEQMAPRQAKKRVWKWNPEDEHPCNIRRVTLSQFLKEFPAGKLPALHPTPIVVTLEDQYRNNDTIPRNERFRNLTTREHILDNFPSEFEVTLSSSNSFSEHRRTVPFETYLAEMLATGETVPTQLSNESWYLFGETYGQEWEPLLERYELPPCTTCTRELVALSFGMGNRGSGVQWHVHGPGFSESIHGRKHWVLYAPSSRNGRDKIPSGFDKDESSRQWMELRYPRARPKPLECTLNPGDFIYFPDRYWHATINLDPYTVFVSSFTTEHHASDEL